MEVIQEIIFSLSSIVILKISSYKLKLSSDWMNITLESDRRIYIRYFHH